MTEIAKVWRQSKVIPLLSIYSAETPWSLSFSLFLCLLSPPFSFPVTRTAFSVSKHIIYLLSSGISPPVSLSPQVPVALTDSLQSVVSRACVNLAPTHKQHTAHPPHKPASIPTIEDTQLKGRQCAWVSCAGTEKPCLCLTEYWILSIPGVRLVDFQQVMEAEEKVLASLLALTWPKKTDR